MPERGRYRTKQQETILACLKQQKSRFLTIEQFMDCLHHEGVSVGQTTVYRFLERLAEDGEVMKLPDEDSSRIRYCYADGEELRHCGKLVCLGCGRFFPLHCDMMNHFLEHIGTAHGFVPDRQHFILYGYCEECRKNGLPHKAEKGINYEHECKTDQSLSEKHPGQSEPADPA